MIEIVLDQALTTCNLLATRHFSTSLLAFAGIYFALTKKELP
jgi:hypothetical protein